ncbi:MAG TPA: phasin family protein [Luteimonas sp.]|nr:phasin family protein [Luteimonas sp.]HRO27427.1 phasin family protein [Luteimonas sp.]HRP71280.1 phasin family protein [Luteimonas sp.]
MAKFKKTAKKSSSAGKAKSDADAQAHAEGLSKSLSDSAQQIWLAGVGAFGRAQAEGTKLFEGLVKEGLKLENTARRFAGQRADDVRDAVENRVGQARERAADTWDRLETVFEDRVQKALVKLGVPGRDDLHDLSQRVDGLTAELRRQRGGAAPRKTAKKAPAKKAPAKKATAKKAATKKAPARKPAAAKAAKVPRKAARKSQA